MTPRAVRSVLFLALVTTAACGKKKEEAPAPAAKPVATDPATPAAAAPAKAPAAAALSSTVSLAVDADNLFAPGAKKVDFTGPAIIHADKQNGGDWAYDVVFYPAGVKADCDTKFELSTPIQATTLEISVNDLLAEPKAGLEIDGKFEVHFLSKGNHTTNGIRDGAKVMLDKIDGTTVTGKLTGAAESTIVGSSGTFTGLLCKWGDEPEAKDDSGENG